MFAHGTKQAGSLLAIHPHACGNVPLGKECRARRAERRTNHAQLRPVLEYVVNKLHGFLGWRGNDSKPRDPVNGFFQSGKEYSWATFLPARIALRILL